jgi:hypothetical protein
MLHCETTQQVDRTRFAFRSLPTTLVRKMPNLLGSVLGQQRGSTLRAEATTRGTPLDLTDETYGVVTSESSEELEHSVFDPWSVARFKFAG